MKGVLLVNLGTPDSTRVLDVRKYLREFLMDARVIDIPFMSRWFLVNLIIAPFRAPKSAKEYKKLFNDRGSPLKYHTQDLVQLLQTKLGNNYLVDFAMRYQSPSIASVLENFRKAEVQSLHVIPLFPQYASATSGSVAGRVMQVVKEWQVIPPISFEGPFYGHPKFLETIVINANSWLKKNEYDHYVFSYHGLPERQIHKGSVSGYCKLGDCCKNLHEHNQYCYRAQCFETSRLIAGKLGIEDSDYTVCFQSRLGKDPWIRPYTEDVLKGLAAKGVKNVLAFSPAFVADCLETTIEVGETYHEDFLEAGGKRWDLVEGLNTADLWVDCLADLVRNG